MADKRKRSQNFSMDEKDKLVKLVYAYKSVILNKKTDGTTNQAKNAAWIKLCNQYNSTGNMYRSKDALTRVWEKMKSKAKIYYTSNRSCTTGTGGGPSYTKTDPILEQVCDLMGRGCSGIANVLDSDAVLTIPDIEVCGEQSQTVVLDGKSDFQGESNDLKETEAPELKQDTPEITMTPLWKRRRPILHKEASNPQAEVVSTLCSGFQGVNNIKLDIENLKKKLLEDEIEFKRKLYELQLESAKTELETKIEIFNQIKGGNFNLKNLFGLPKTD